MKQILTILAASVIFIVACKKNTPDAPPPTAPLVTTGAVTRVTDSTATAAGSIVSDGGAAVTKSGVVWSTTNATPTISDSIVAAIATTGAFTVNLSRLNFNNTYYIRAFATNSAGTGYGAIVAIGAGSDTSKVRFMYNGQQVAYGIIISPTTGKKWLDRNLGAKRQAISVDDYQAYGDLFQWGRPADGHQLMNWTSSSQGTPVNGTTTTVSVSDIPGISNFIIAPSSPTVTLSGDWRDDNNRNRWAIHPQGPCPDGWHVPTQAELMAEADLYENNGYSNGGTPGGITTKQQAYSKLKLVVAGFRVAAGDNAGQLFQGLGPNNPGGGGFYWSSSDKGINYIYYGGRGGEFGGSSGQSRRK